MGGSAGLESQLPLLGTFGNNMRKIIVLSYKRPNTFIHGWCCCGIGAAFNINCWSLFAIKVVWLNKYYGFYSIMISAATGCFGFNGYVE